MQTVGRGSNFCDFSLITKKKKITRKYRILSSILHQCDFPLISYLTLTLILVFKPQNRYTKSERRNHLSVFFAKIIRLLRKLFNDLSLTRTRFGRRLSLSPATGTCAIFTTSQKQYNYQTSPAVV